MSKKSDLKQKTGFVGFRRITEPQVGVEVRALSPVNLIVTDPDGFTITAQTLVVTEREHLREVSGVLYYSEWDIDGDGTLDDIVIAPTLRTGDYIIEIIPESDALPTDVYTLEIEAAGTTITLAQNVPINDIPSQGYGIRSTGEAISQFIPVAIDIKPGSFPNSINPKSKGKIPVAILSATTFDAPLEVDASSLTFGRTGYEPSLAFCNSGGGDMNGDGILDLVCHFHTQAAAFHSGDTQGILKGETIDGTPITGKDSVRIVP